MRMWIVVDIEEDAPPSSTPALIWYFNLAVVQDEILELETVTMEWSWQAFLVLLAT